MYMTLKKALFGEGWGLSLLIAAFAVRDSEQTSPIHHTNAIHIPPFGYSIEKSYISVTLYM